MSPLKHAQLDLGRTPFTGRAERKVRELLQSRIRPARGMGVVVAVSGGPDSSALAVILSRLARSFELRLTMAHFDHMLRGRRAARADEDYVRRLGEALSLPVVTGAGDVVSEARARRTSREDAARRLRYEFLGRTARKTRSAWVALGHTLDDRAETVLLHIIRGAGLSGLASLEPAGRWPFGVGPGLMRPLLMLRREETARYCREAGLSPMADPTNELPVATRNRIRASLMPVLRGFNPRIEEALARLGEAAALDVDYLTSAADAAYSRMAQRTRWAVVLPADQLASLHPALKSRVIMRAAAVAGCSGTLQALHIEQVSRLVEARAGSVPLPGGVAAVMRNGSLRLRRVR